MKICLGTGLILLAVFFGAGMMELLAAGMTEIIGLWKLITVGIFPSVICCVWFQKMEMTGRRRLPCFVEREEICLSVEDIGIFDS